MSHNILNFVINAKFIYLKKESKKNQFYVIYFAAFLCSFYNYFITIQRTQFGTNENSTAVLLFHCDRQICKKKKRSEKEQRKTNNQRIVFDESQKPVVPLHMLATFKKQYKPFFIHFLISSCILLLYVCGAVLSAK